MADVEMDAIHACGLQCAQHQRLDLDVALQSGVTIDLGTDLHRLAGAQQPRRLGMQHRARVTQSGDTLTVEQMCIDAGYLRRHVRAQPEQPPGQLVHQLEGSQIQVMSRAGQQ